jgi:hypothetical protein
MKDGEAAFKALYAAIAKIGAETSDPDTEQDACDFCSMTQLVARALQDNVSADNPARSAGFLRALTHLIYLSTDDSAPGPNWSPVAQTEASFRAPGLAEAAIRRARATT